ncbi:MAG: hypothetical protein RR328_01090 [Bacteroidales bacterium]
MKNYSFKFSVKRDILLLLKQDVYLLFFLLPFLGFTQNKYNATFSTLNKENVDFKVKSLLRLSDDLYTQGKYKEACDTYNAGVSLRDSIMNIENEKKINQLSKQYNTYKIRTQNELLEKDLAYTQLQNERRNIIGLILLVLSLLLLFFIIKTIRRIILKNGNKRDLSQKISIEESQKDEKEKNNQQQQKQRLDQQQKELMSNMLFLMKANEIFNTVNGLFKQKMQSKDEEKCIEKTKEIASILDEYKPDQGWDEFKLYFEKIHTSFYTQLNQLNPELSQLEERLCALVALNMNAVEIAELTNRSVRTIETVIYGIRKKLNIPKELKTVTFLRQFLNVSE